MSKIQDVPFITKVIDTLSDELKSGLYDLIDGQVKTPIFRSLVNNDYAITEANDKGKVQFVTLETLRGNYTGYLAYNSVYCVLIAFKGNTQALDMLNINVAKHTFAFVNESLSILELRVELEDGKKGVTPTDLGVTNNNIHLAKGTTQIGEGVNFKTVGGETIVGSGNVGFKTINDQEIVGDGNIVVGEGGTITIDTAFDETSTNAVQNKVITEYITDLESKVSTLAVKVYNHDIALGTLNIENVLYSVENADSFAIPTTIGTNVDVVIPKSRMALSAIKGKTEYSRNLIGFDDATDTKNGVTMTIKNGVLTLNGTATQETYFYPTKSMPNTLNGTYTIYGYGNGSVTLRINYSVDGVRKYDFYTPSDTPNSKTFNGTETNFGFEIIVNNGVTLNNVVVKPMLVKGSTAPTSFVPYYTGLKNVELNYLNVYGENFYKGAQGLNISKQVDTPSQNLGVLPKGTYTLSWKSIGDSSSYLSIREKGSSTNLYTFNLNNTITGTSKTITIASDEEIIFAFDNYYASENKTFDDVMLAYGSTALSYEPYKEPTPLLPSSILPKTLASYERLEVVDNGDDTYKINLVSHAELHVGDKINSLWVGNPQSENYGSGTHWYLRLQNSSLSLDTQIWSSSTYGNRLYINRASYIANADEMVISDGIALFGGNDTYIDKTSTRRNIVVNFNNQLTFTEKSTDSSFFNSDFRNGEETRTTLIDGLSLDDVSAIIDTGDIVYADNSNAEYDVSIAETSVELLVNKTN